jgi:hypothetical protein
MPWGQSLAVFKELGGPLTAVVADRITAGRFEVTLDFVFDDFHVQNANVGKIQQLFDGNIHWEMLDDDCRLITTISWGHFTTIPKETKTALVLPGYRATNQTCFDVDTPER